MEFLTAVEWFIVAIVCFFLLVLTLMYYVFRAKDNPIFCWQLIASKNAQGEERADIDKLGKVLALFVMILAVIYFVATNKLDMLMLALLTLFLTYAGGIASFSAYMRSRQGMVTPPAPLPPPPITTTTTETVTK